MSISRVSSPFFLDDQVYECIVQTASTGFQQIAQKLNDLHMETVRDIVIVERCLGCGVTVLFIIKLFGEELGLLKGLKACQSCRCWSFAALPRFRPLAQRPAGCIPRLTRSSITSTWCRAAPLTTPWKQSWPSSRLTRWRSRPRSVSPNSAPPIRGSSRTCRTTWT